MNAKKFELFLRCAFQEIWACNLCKKKQDILVKTGQWYHGGMAKPVGLDIDTGSDASSVKTDNSPVQDRRMQFTNGRPSLQHYRQGSTGQQRLPNMPRQESLQANLDSSAAGIKGRELRRQYSLSDKPRSNGGRGDVMLDLSTSLQCHHLERTYPNNDPDPDEMLLQQRLLSSNFDRRLSRNNSDTCEPPSQSMRPPSSSGVGGVRDFQVTLDQKLTEVEVRQMDRGNVDFYDMAPNDGRHLARDASRMGDVRAPERARSRERSGPHDDFVRRDPSRTRYVSFDGLT